MAERIFSHCFRCFRCFRIVSAIQDPAGGTGGGQSTKSNIPPCIRKKVRLKGLREMFSEARGSLLTQRRHLAPCRKRDAFPARQRYKLFCSIQIFFSRGEGVGGLRTVLRCGLRPMRGAWPAANGWGGLRPEIWENLGGKSEKIVIGQWCFRIVFAVFAVFAI